MKEQIEMHRNRIKMIDSYSFSLLLMLLIIVILLVFFFISLGSIGYLLGIILSFGFIKNFDYAIFYDDLGVYSLKYLCFLKKIKYEDIFEIRCENIGAGRSKTTAIYIHYNEDEKVSKSILLHYRISGNKKLFLFLKKIKNNYKIKIKNFIIMNIDIDKIG
jgi:hypothetical protein